MLTDLLAHQYADDPSKANAEEFEDDSFDPEDIEAQWAAEAEADAAEEAARTAAASIAGVNDWEEI